MQVISLETMSNFDTQFVHTEKRSRIALLLLKTQVVQ